VTESLRENDVVYMQVRSSVSKPYSDLELSWDMEPMASANESGAMAMPAFNSKA